MKNYRINYKYLRTILLERPWSHRDVVVFTCKIFNTFTGFYTDLRKTNTHTTRKKATVFKTVEDKNIFSLTFNIPNCTTQLLVFEISTARRFRITTSS